MLQYILDHQGSICQKLVHTLKMRSPSAEQISHPIPLWIPVSPPQQVHLSCPCVGLPSPPQFCLCTLISECSSDACCQGVFIASWFLCIAPISYKWGHLLKSVLVILSNVNGREIPFMLSWKSLFDSAGSRTEMKAGTENTQSKIPQTPEDQQRTFSFF